MVLGGSRTDGSGAGNTISIPVRKTIQSIKEIVRNHSDAEIYAMLKETDMDPNETAQKLLNQDPFHEVKRRRDKKKEHVGYRSSAETRKPMDHPTQWAKPPTSWDQNTRRGGYSRNPAPGISREFRIVRDNRVNQNTSSDSSPETIQHQASGNQQVPSNAHANTSTGVPSDQKHSTAENPEGHIASQGAIEPLESGSTGAKSVGVGGSRRSSSSEVMQSTISVSTSQVPKEVKNNSQTPATLTSTNNVIGVYSSSSDPVHVPNPDSRSAGKVGAIRREVGVVGGRRQSSDRSITHSPISNNTSAPPLKKDVASVTASTTHHAAISNAAISTAISKSNQVNQTPSEPNIHSTPTTSKSFSSSQYTGKAHQQTAGHQKAAQPNMEWKPKQSQKPAVGSPSTGTTSALSTSFVDNSSNSRPVEAAVFTEKLSQVDVVETQHVIIPNHLRVPESERTRLTFGSFGADFDSCKNFTSTQPTESAESLNDEPSLSVSASPPLGSIEDASATDQGDAANGQSRTQSDSPASSEESEQLPTDNNESHCPQNIESYEEIGLVTSHSPPYSSPKPHQLQNPSSLPNFTAYSGNQSSYDVPFFRTVMEDNVRGQGLTSQSETLSSNAANGSSSSNVAMTQQLAVQQQQQAVQQQQQQPVTQMYPQVQISHFPNFVPYRHVYSPVYVPPMAIPNYPSNPSYPLPSNGSSYLLMPGASSHLAAGGMKYASSQYKPVPAGSPTGYGNYTNPAGLTISTPSSIGGATGLEDMTRVKYKDNSLYVPNQQAESSDIWVQTPREVPGLQSAPYYNLPGQGPHAAFMPPHAGHASFNSVAQSSHVQYPGLYHPQQPASVPGAHHLVHQQVNPGFGGGVGVAAPAPQVGSYQQPQMNHLNWTTNF